MRHLFATAIAGLALSTLLVGAASASGWAASGQAQPSSTNAAEQADLQRDAAQKWTRRGGEGVIVSRGDMSASLAQPGQNASDENSKPWLRRSPAGEIVGHPSNTAIQNEQSHMMDH